MSNFDRLRQQSSLLIAKSRLVEIERSRDRMRYDDTPLVDGSFGDAGPFDYDGEGKSHTVAKVVGVSRSKTSAENLFFHILSSRARHGIEIGTNVGVSSAYIGAAMDAHGPDWTLTTFEASPYRIRLARKLHASARLDDNITCVQGLFYETLPVVMASSERAFDLAFIDGQHQYQPTLDFMNIVYERAAPESLFIFDDIEWSDEMRGAWAAIRSDSRVVFSTEANGVGFCILLKEAA